MNCRIGPYARIRPGSFIGKHCQIGNFVEVKNTKMASNCKINHHSFIGDSKIGRNVIIGAEVSPVISTEQRPTSRSSATTRSSVGRYVGGATQRGQKRVYWGGFHGGE